MADPFDPEVQRKIEERIQRVSSNLGRRTPFLQSHSNTKKVLLRTMTMLCQVLLNGSHHIHWEFYCCVFGGNFTIR